MANGFPPKSRPASPRDVPPTSANDLTPPAEQVERFRRDFEAIAGRAPDAEHKLGVGISGGVDSLALLLLAAAAYPGLVVAATVDHGLRPEAAEEAAFVHSLCGRLDVPHDVLTRPDWTPPVGNLQEWARWLRYLLLNLWGASGTIPSDRPWRTEWVAVAHQQNDVAETFLMRARRGAGVGGLAAMAATRPLTPMPGPRLVRPLLDWSRAELAQIVTAAGIAPVEDPSNVAPRFDRSRIRGLIAANPELPPARLALAAQNLRHAEDALKWMAEREWRERVRIEGTAVVRFDPTGLPYELRRRLVRGAIDWWHEQLGRVRPWRGTGLDRLVATLDSGGTGTIAGVKASAKHAEWHFSAAPARRSH
jgi:tRNA(Ile)-lysidine synthase